MKAVYIKELGGAEGLEWRDVEDLPRPQADRVVVKVKAAALNRADLLQRRGLYPAPQGFPQEIPGLEFAGEVIETGAEARTFKAGQRVFGITAGAAQAEFVSVPESTLVEIPANLDFIQAAAVPEAFITAHDALFTQADLKMGETVLIHAVGSGVGLAGLQLAKAVNAKVIGTSRTAGKLERAEEYGLDRAILDFGFWILDSKNQDLPTDAGFLIQNPKSKIQNQMNVVLDLVGAKYLAANLQSLAKHGRLIFVGTTAGSKAEIDYSIVMSKRLHIFGTVLRSRSTEEKALATRLFAGQVVPLLASGEVKPTVDRVFPASEVRTAHEYLESNQSFGKVVLQISE